LNEPRLILLRRAINELDLSTYNEAIGDLMRLELVLDRPVCRQVELVDRSTKENETRFIQRHPIGVAGVSGEFQRPEHLGENDVWDWAGVEGQWCGSYAFLE
jgi:hypothetical protein